MGNRPSDDRNKPGSNPRGPIDRREFVRTGSLLLVATACNSEGIRTEPTARGTIHLTLTGVHSQAANGGVATATPSIGGTGVTVTIPANGDQSAVVPIGTYLVSYDPPDDHVLAPGTRVPPVVVIAEGETTTVSLTLVPTGDMSVSVTGLSGTAGGSAVAQRTDASAGPISIPIQSTGSGSATEVPVGTYTVTYTAPAGFSVSSANPLTGLSVAFGTTATPTFAVAAASPTDGSVAVTVTGLTGAAAGGAISARLTDNTGSTFTGVLPVPSSGSSSLTLSGLPAGSYNVTYAPSSGFQLATGQTNPQVVAVIAATTVSAGFVAQAIPLADGAVQVTVTGLSGAMAGGSVALRLTNNTGNTFTGNLSVPSGGSSSATVSVPPGDYNVTYTPPTGYQLAPGQTNPHVVLVQTAQTANTSFIAQQIPAAADGSVQVSISGLTGAAAGGSVTARLTNNTGNIFGGTLPAPVSGATTLTLTGMPAGAYNVTYTPPAGYELTAGQANPKMADVVSGTPASVAFTAQQIVVVPGAVQVTATGLTGAVSGGTVSARLANNTGNTFTANLSAPVSGSSSATLSDMPAGSYNVTYTPPAGFELTAGQTNPRSVTVTSGGTANTTFANQQIPVPGDVQVTVTGLTGALAGGSVSARRTNNTGNTFTATLPAPTGDTSAATLGGLPAGSYNVTYTPPAGYQLAAGQTNPHVVTVTSGATANTAFVASQIVTPAGLVFASDWRTAVGNSAAAVGDGGKWDDFHTGTTRLMIVAATGLDFPAGMSNVIQGRYRESESNYWIIQKFNGWPAPAIGGVLCDRFYFRHTLVGTSISFHPVEPEPGGCATESNITITGQNPFSFQVRSEEHRWETTLSRGVTYRIERRFERTGTNAWIIHVRIFDSAGVMVRSDADFDCVLGHGTHRMSDQPVSTISPTCIRNHCFNWQGGGGNRGSDDENNNRIYYGGYAVSLSDWCGAYSPSEIP